VRDAASTWHEPDVTAVAKANLRRAYGWLTKENGSALATSFTGRD